MRKYLPYIVTLVATGVAVFFLRRAILSAEGSQNFVFSPWLLVGSLAAFLIQESLNPVFAALALKSVGASTRYFPQLLITMFSTSANSTVPVPAGMPIRAYLQKQILNISYTKSGGAILIETVVGYGFTLTAAIVTGMIWFPQYIDPQFFLNQNVLTILLFGLLISGLIVAGVVFFVRKKQLQKRITEALIQLSNARLLPLLGMAFIMLVSFGLALTRFALILLAMGIDVQYGPLLAALLISRIAGVLSFVPMGLGVRDASLGSLLIIIGVLSSQAIAAAAIDRLILTIPYLIGGVIATHLLSKRFLLPENLHRPS